MFLIQIEFLFLSIISVSNAFITNPKANIKKSILIQNLKPTILKSSEYLQEEEEEGEEEEDLYEIHWISDISPYSYREEEESKSLGESIAKGEAVICIPNIASEEECTYLFQSGLLATKARSGASTRGRSRFSVSDPNAFNSNVVLTCDEILLRVLDDLDDFIPSIYDTLFKPSDKWLVNQPLNAQLEQPTVPPPLHLAEMCVGLRDLYMMGDLEWSEGEPAINIYEQGGHFGCHKDHLALTVLIPLTSPNTDFTKGGTGFWAGNRETDESPFEPADLILCPDAGSALVFGGDVTHAGIAIESGLRSVLVCSFSTKTSASNPDRLHGLQAPPQVSPTFKGA